MALRKGEIVADPNDKRTRTQKQKALKEVKKSNWFTDLWKSESRKVCEERLNHYESTGNTWKASIYRRKLSR